ncbi:MAG: hypothetical protein ABI151_14110 [Chitinophagaceae bacterium]
MKRCFVLIVVVMFVISCKDKAPKMDPTPNFSPTNNSVDIMVDTLGFKIDSAKVKDTSRPVK